MKTNPDYDCPDCGEPALVDTSTNYSHEWTCTLCESVHDPKDVHKL